jgi:hypothetical protein
VPLLGPALAHPKANADWVSTLLGSGAPNLAAVTVHRYPYSACASPFSRGHPTIARLLSENATEGLARSVLRVVRIAAQAGLRVRLTELNSVTCGGSPGVSDTFATALWAPDALFELMRIGVISADVHIRADAINMAFTLTGHGLVAHPLLYGLLAFVRTLGSDSRLLRIELHARRSLHVKAWAVLVHRNLLHVLVIDKGGRAVQVALLLPWNGPAAVQRLLAPSVRSTSGVTLDGQRLAPSGAWVGRPVSETIRPRRVSAALGSYRLAVPPYTAALIAVRLARASIPGAR